MMTNLTAPDDFRPTASWENLRLRAELLRRLREYFHRRGFLEVETPSLSADTVVDRHLDPFSVVVSSEAGDPESAVGTGQLHRPHRRMWLQTSPELAMKRLLAAGGPPIYQVARAFRQHEQGPLHNPEFTIVEWYCLGGTMAEGMELLSDLCNEMLQRGTAEQLSYAGALRRYVGLDPHLAETAELVAAARSCGLEPPETLAADDRDGWLDLLLVERVQPHLGSDRPVILYDFPPGQAALARVRPGQPPVAERFELYVEGVELANGYHELVDPAELRQRIAQANAQRRADGKPPLPEQNRLLAAMEAGLPAATGAALGFDRLVMVAAGAKSLKEVMAFPFDRA